jgi:hypothetical protein
MGLEIPGVYFVFYDFFFKSSSGDMRWKEACMEAGAKTNRLGSRLGEAFAMLVLKNNYFAWLLEAKMKLGQLVTDYDTEARRQGKKNVVESYLKLEFDLPEAPPTTADSAALGVVQEDVAATNAETVCIVDIETEGYEVLQKKTADALKSARRVAKNNKKYAAMKKDVLELQKEEAAREANTKAAAAEAEREDGGIDEEALRITEEEAREEKSVHLKKRRRLLKSFREYTVRQNDEGKFKGWSKRAADEMTIISKRLKEESTSERAKMFNAAYRQVYCDRNKGKRKAEDEEHEPVDYSELWDLDEEDMTAV